MAAVDVQDIPYFTVEVDVQDLQHLPTKSIDKLELSDIHLIEKYILDNVLEHNLGCTISQHVDAKQLSSPTKQSQQ